jgi:hypothetical protein
MKNKVVIISLFFFIITAATGTARPASFTGKWNTNWGPMDITQKGSQVMGHYTGQYKGIIEGTVSGNRLDFTWSQPDGQFGKGYFIISSDGSSINGAWGMKDSDSDGGPWTGTRVSGGDQGK